MKPQVTILFRGRRKRYVSMHQAMYAWQRWHWSAIDALLDMFADEIAGK